MTQPTREEVQAFIDALKYGMKVSHKPEFLIALAERWLSSTKEECDHRFVPTSTFWKECTVCGKQERR